MLEVPHADVIKAFKEAGSTFEVVVVSSKVLDAQLSKDKSRSGADTMDTARGQSKGTRMDRGAPSARRTRVHIHPHL